MAAPPSKGNPIAPRSHNSMFHTAQSHCRYSYCRSACLTRLFTGTVPGYSGNWHIPTATLAKPSGLLHVLVSASMSAQWESYREPPVFTPSRISRLTREILLFDERLLTPSRPVRSSIC